MFTDDYGRVRWLAVGAVAAAIVCAVSLALWAVNASTSPASALVASKQTQWDDDTMIYFLLLDNGVRQRVSCSQWESAQPGSSYSTYSSAAEDEDPAGQAVSDPDITDPDTQYNIPQSSVAAASSTVTDTLPASDEDFSDDEG